MKDNTLEKEPTDTETASGAKADAGEEREIESDVDEEREIESDVDEEREIESDAQAETETEIDSAKTAAAKDPVKKKKKKHVVLKIFLCIVGVIVLAALALGIHLFTAWKDSEKVYENADMQHYSYVLRLTLDREKLSRGMEDALDALAELTGIGREKIMHLRIVGRMNGGVIHTVIYVDGINDPLTEIYTDGRKEIVNAAMVYTRIRANAVSKIKLAGKVLPVWDDREYMTMDQMKRMLEADIRELASLAIDLSDFSFSRKEMFLAMAVMWRKGHDYTLKAVKGMTAKLTDVSGQDPLKLDISIRDADKAISDLDKKLSMLGVDISLKKLGRLKDMQLEITFDDDWTMRMPGDDRMVSDATVEKVAGIRSFLKKLL